MRIRGLSRTPRGGHRRPDVITRRFTMVNVNVNFVENNDHFFIYGGSGDKGRSMGDFYFLNLKNWVWKRLFILEVPPSRNHHTLTDSGKMHFISKAINAKEKIIFGGICLPENVLLNDVWIFNYENLAYRKCFNLGILPPPLWPPL